MSRQVLDGIGNTMDCKDCEGDGDALPAIGAAAPSSSRACEGISACPCSGGTSSDGERWPGWTGKATFTGRDELSSCDCVSGGGGSRLVGFPLRGGTGGVLCELCLGANDGEDLGAGWSEPQSTADGQGGDKMNPWLLRIGTDNGPDTCCTKSPSARDDFLCNASSNSRSLSTLASTSGTWREQTGGVVATLGMFSNGLSFNCSKTASETTCLSPDLKSSEASGEREITLPVGLLPETLASPIMTDRWPGLLSGLEEKTEGVPKSIGR